jgi:hypothetical protein
MILKPVRVPRAPVIITTFTAAHAKPVLSSQSIVLAVIIATARHVGDFRI